MSDQMHVLPFDALLRWILTEYQANGSIFGIHRSLFYTPRDDAPYALDDLYGHRLAAPIGPAAGPHTQLAQNILCAWLSGGRFIELKTVQVMDELDIPRPCIDAEDEGYNVEWSQELKLDQSAREYVKAWALIHVLRRLLGWERTPLGTILNMSVGYNLEGVQSPPMTRFMDRLQDASADLAEIRSTLQAHFPQFADLDISPYITNNVTLSTMHGCPPDEIEAIARYLMQKRGLHCTVKLNPTLLGKARVLEILHDRLGYREIHIPDAVFDHDLQYARALELIAALQAVAAERGLVFGVKLSNTLAMSNHRNILPGDEMYMSGRALYPVTLNLFARLARDVAPLNVSYSAGADALNVATLLSTGARPVTVASDLLKPGGYSRLAQYLESLETEMRRHGAADLDQWARDRVDNLARAARDALHDPRYAQAAYPYGAPKVDTTLPLVDCIAAPCTAQCAVCQDVPAYAWWIARGEVDRALDVILARNPLPGVTGHVCTHLCQTRCTRSSYDQPVAIRALKRFAAERGRETGFFGFKNPVSASRVAIVGSGPSGLAAAYYLALSGIQATIFEARDVPGGMLALAPGFRLPPAVVQQDIERIAGLGVRIELSHPITIPPRELLASGYDAVYIACGFSRDATLDLEGIDGQGVYTALDLLARVAHGDPPDLGSRVLVIGGGNTAMDAARTARRLTGHPATVVYRRTQHEMPAEEEELEDLLAEGNTLIELASPTRVLLDGGRVAALECVRNRLGEPDAGGRRRPEPVPGSAFQIPADAIVLAIGQQPDLAFLDGSGVSLRPGGAIAVDEATGSTGAACVYAGGDAVRGPAIIVEACADGRRAAEAICAHLGADFIAPAAPLPVLGPQDILQVKRARARREARHQPAALPVERRGGFDLVEATLSETAARQEAARCLQCSVLCDKCVEVCPNRANYPYTVEPVQWSLPLLSYREGRLVVTGEEPFQIAQTRQIVHLDDLCNECGNCATFCVHQGKPYLDKPRLFLQQADFERETGNAFYIQGDTIRARHAGREANLSASGGRLIYQDDHLRVEFSPRFEPLALQARQPFDGPRSLRLAAVMAVLLRSIPPSLPFLF